MDNSTFNILEHQFYINENDRDELYIITGTKYQIFEIFGKYVYGKRN